MVGLFGKKKIKLLYKQNYLTKKPKNASQRNRIIFELKRSIWKQIVECLIGKKIKAINNNKANQLLSFAILPNDSSPQQEAFRHLLPRI